MWRGSREDIGHSSVLETKRSGMEVAIIHLKEKGFRRITNGGTIPRNRSPCCQDCQCFESRDPEKNEQQRHHTLQFGCFEHRTLVSNDSLSKSAPYLRSSFKLVWRVGWKAKWERMDFRQVCIKNTWRNTEERESTRSELFGTNSKEWCTSIRKRIARLSSELWITGEEYSINKNLRRRVILEQSLHWDVLQDHFWRRWWFEIEPQHAESMHTLVQGKIPELMPQLQE